MPGISIVIQVGLATRCNVLESLRHHLHNNENLIILKQYYIYNYTPLYLKVVYN